MRTPITYYGGKQNLSERIVSMMPRHKIYCEEFFESELELVQH